MVWGLRTLVKYFKGRCPAAVTDCLKNNPTHSSHCMRTNSSRGVPSGASFFFNFIYAELTWCWCVHTHLIILNKVDSAIKLNKPPNEALLSTYISWRNNCTTLPYVLLGTWQVWKHRCKAFPALHPTTSCNLYAFLESDWNHPSSFIGVGYEPRVIFSNSKDEAWSQHKHLHGLDNLKNTCIDFICNGTLSSVVVDDLKGSNKGKTRVKLEWEKVLNHIQFIALPREVKYMSLHQYRETVPNCPYCWSLQFTEMLYSNPDCEKQCKGLHILQWIRSVSDGPAEGTISRTRRGHPTWAHGVYCSHWRWMGRGVGCTRCR